MIFEAQRAFALPFPGTVPGALAFVRDPARTLSQVRFLRALHADGEGVRGELLVPVPLLGDVDLPFHSRLSLTPDGAALLPQPLTAERAWVEVAGQAHAEAGEDGPQLHFSFQFRAHLALPDTGSWGGAAFEKMVRAAAARTLERVSQELPVGIAWAATGAAQAPD